TVMIQLGSIVAVMRLYRAKLATVVRGLPSDPDARPLAVMLIVAEIRARDARVCLACRPTRPPVRGDAHRGGDSRARRRRAAVRLRQARVVRESPCDCVGGYPARPAHCVGPRA